MHNAANPWSKFAPPQVEVTALPGGGQILRSREPLRPSARHVGKWLETWAARAPTRTFLAERAGPEGWRRVSYAEAAAAANAIGQALLDRRLTSDRPVLTLSDNGIDLALLQLGAMQVGIPAALASPAYSLQSQDFEKLRYIARLLQPGPCMPWMASGTSAPSLAWSWAAPPSWSAPSLPPASARRSSPS